MNCFRVGPRLCQPPRSHNKLLWTADIVYKSCRRQGTLTPIRMVPTPSLRPLSHVKPYYVTTPIFYVNAAPHVGHMYTMVLTDILKRWQVLRGKSAILCTGTDEHGMKVQQASEKANVSPKEFCDRGAEVFKKLAARANLSNDHFVRTTDDDHKEAAQYFWRMLNERGYIYEKKHEGYYCVSDETFYPTTALEKRQDPFTGKLFLASKETGKEVEWTSEINYHFRLSAFKDRLLKFYHQNPQFVIPKARMNDVVKWVEEDLEDLSISRPSSRLKWGIPVPDDHSQTMYVWLDALVNYITKAGYPWAPGSEMAGGWPADVQVIGKDIVRFHCIYWPAFLLALDIPPPRQILTHAHWTISKKKMSKSDGTGVDPELALNRFGVDVMRFYLAYDGGIVDDADYSNEYIVERYKKNLQGGLGNLVNRLTKGRQWNVRVAVEEGHRENSSPIPQSAEETVAFRQIIESLRDEVDDGFKNLNSGYALKRIMHVIWECNRYWSMMEPWHLATSGDQTRLLEVVYHSAEAVRVAGILLQPFMPEKSSMLLDMLGVDDTRRAFMDTKFGVDGDYGIPRVDLNGPVTGSLFPPLAVEN